MDLEGSGERRGKGKQCVFLKCRFCAAMKLCAPKEPTFCNSLLRSSAVGPTEHIPHKGHSSPRQPGTRDTEPKPCFSGQRHPGGPAWHACTRMHLHAPSAPRAMQNPAGRVGAHLRAHLGSSGKAPTEFWSEELEKAGKERVRASFLVCKCGSPLRKPGAGGCLCPCRRGAQCLVGCTPSPSPHPIPSPQLRGH